MKSKRQLIQWADSQSEDLQRNLHWQAGEYGGGYWVADDASNVGNSMAQVASALDFLRQFAGAESEWFVRAKIAYESKGDGSSFESGVYAVGEILRSWADQVQKGVVDVPRAEAASLRGAASTDIMSQVRTLVEDRSVHPAAPIVLAGAALEIALRAATEEKQVELLEKPGIAAFGRALRKRDLISKQDMKDVEQMAGLRNAAAHGEFDDLSFERAGLMEQQVNLFLRRLALLLGDSDE